MHLFEFFLIRDLHLLNFWSICEPMIERYTLIPERRITVLIEPDDHHILALFTDLYQMRVRARNRSRVFRRHGSTLGGHHPVEFWKSTSQVFRLIGCRIPKQKKMTPFIPPHAGKNPRDRRMGPPKGEAARHFPPGYLLFPEHRSDANPHPADVNDLIEPVRL